MELFFILAFLQVAVWLWRLSKKVSEQRSQTHAVDEPTTEESDVGGIIPYHYTRTTSDVLKKPLPEVIHCPQCKQPVMLTAEERTHHMFACPHCGHGYQESSTAVSVTASHPITYTFVDEELGEKLDVISQSVLPPLPERVRCMHCAALLDLVFEERNVRRFRCPTCSKTNEAFARRFDSRLQRWLEGFTLKPFVVCPNCNTELQLEQGERMTGAFVCPECRRRSEFTRDTAGTLSQYFLSSHPVCPECSKENTLTNDERTKEAFLCSGCGEIIQYIEE